MCPGQRQSDPGIAEGSKQGTRPDCITGQAMPRQRNPETLLSPRQHEVRRGASRADARIERRGSVVLLPQCPRGVRVAVVQEPKALEILWRAGSVMCRPVRRADYRVQLVIHQRYAGKPGPGPATHPDREIGAFVDRRVETLVDDQGHFEPRMYCFERGESGTSHRTANEGVVAMATECRRLVSRTAATALSSSEMQESAARPSDWPSAEKVRVPRTGIGSLPWSVAGTSKPTKSGAVRT